MGKIEIERGTKMDSGRQFGLPAIKYWNLCSNWNKIENGFYGMITRRMRRRAKNSRKSDNSGPGQFYLSVPETEKDELLAFQQNRKLPILNTEELGQNL